MRVSRGPFGIYPCYPNKEELEEIIAGLRWSASEGCAIDDELNNRLIKQFEAVLKCPEGYVWDYHEQVCRPRNLQDDIDESYRT